MMNEISDTALEAYCLGLWADAYGYEYFDSEEEEEEKE